MYRVAQGFGGKFKTVHHKGPSTLKPLTSRTPCITFVKWRNFSKNQNGPSGCDVRFIKQQTEGTKNFHVS